MSSRRSLLMTFILGAGRGAEGLWFGRNFGNMRLVSKVRERHAPGHGSSQRCIHHAVNGDTDVNIATVETIRESLRCISERSKGQTLSELASDLRQLSCFADSALEEGNQPSRNATSERLSQGLTVVLLKEALRARGLPTNGVKAELVQRLDASSGPEQAQGTAGAVAGIGAVPGSESFSEGVGSQGKNWWGGDYELKRVVEETIRRFANKGPQSGIFTDGGASPNPGAGGWAAVAVENGHCLSVLYGYDPATTNNRMEMEAVIAALKSVQPSSSASSAATAATPGIYSDSALVVNTLNTWASGWEGNGWIKGDKKPPLNLDLVKEAHALYQARAGAVVLRKIKAHDGSTWNEVADVVATFARERAT